jgi:hypothetical protein
MVSATSRDLVTYIAEKSCLTSAGLGTIWMVTELRFLMTVLRAHHQHPTKTLGDGRRLHHKAGRLKVERFE